MPIAAPATIGTLEEGAELIEDAGSAEGASLSVGLLDPASGAAISVAAGAETVWAFPGVSILNPRSHARQGL